MSFYTWFVWSSSNTALGWYVSQISLNLWWFFSFFIFCHLFGKGTGSFLTEFPTFRILLILPHVIILLHFFYFYTYCNLAVSSWLPLWLSSKELPAMQESLVQSLGWKVPLRRKWQPTPVFLPEKSHGQRSLVGYSPLVTRVGHNLSTKLSAIRSRGLDHSHVWFFFFVRSISQVVLCPCCITSESTSISGCFSFSDVKVD